MIELLLLGVGAYALLNKQSATPAAAPPRRTSASLADPVASASLADPVAAATRVASLQRERAAAEDDTEVDAPAVLMVAGRATPDSSVGERIALGLATPPPVPTLQQEVAANEARTADVVREAVLTKDFDPRTTYQGDLRMYPPGLPILRGLYRMGIRQDVLGTILNENGTFS